MLGMEPSGQMISLPHSVCLQDGHWSIHLALETLQGLVIVKIHKDLSNRLHMSKQNCISVKMFFFYFGGGNFLVQCSVL